MSANISTAHARITTGNTDSVARKTAKRHQPWQRWAVVGLAALAVGLWALAYTRPWWQFYLFAPQYPNGLVLDVSLSGVGGDAREVSMLNHYIGMKSLNEAAQVERKLAVYGIGLVALLTLALTLVVGKRWNWLALVPALAFPLGFVGDSMWWLYHFGHTLDRHAPLNIPLFTPQFFGWGKIGQFETYAMPLGGFWMAIGAFGLMLVAVVLRYRVCKTCPLYKTCGATCPKKLVGSVHLHDD